MFGFSFTKLIVLAIVVVVVWQAFKYLGGGQKRAPATRGKDTEPARADGIDTVECPVCNTYVTASQDGCGRKDCPYA